MPDNWAADHHAIVLDHMRRQLAAILDLHLPLCGEAGHLTKDDIKRELLAAFAVVDIIEVKP
jgi:hypothetical protein